MVSNQTKVYSYYFRSFIKDGYSPVQSHVLAMREAQHSIEFNNPNEGQLCLELKTAKEL